MAENTEGQARRYCECVTPSEYVRGDFDGWHCDNCGKVKILSRPCGFDHLAAILEWNTRRGDAS